MLPHPCCDDGLALGLLTVSLRPANMVCRVVFREAALCIGTNISSDGNVQQSHQVLPAGLPLCKGALEEMLYNRSNTHGHMLKVQHWLCPKHPSTD